MHPLLGMILEGGSPKQAPQDFVKVIADKAIAVVADRLKERRSIKTASINDAPSLRASRVSINTWAKWRKPDQNPTAAFGEIESRITELIALRLSGPTRSP